MKTRLLALLLLSMVSARWAMGQPSGPFLSSLSASKDSPLYTTYAATMARSEFTLDKGYHFVCYDSSRGADLSNELGGDLCLAFKRGSKYVYAVQDMARPPVITTSYSDLVQYTFFPFEEIQVNVTFLVYSSRFAIQAIDIKNLAATTTRVEVLPFLQNSRRTFEDIEFRDSAGAITFSHEELPDDWVVEHNVPYVAAVRDVYALSDPPDRMMSFRSYRWGAVEIPPVHDLGKQPACLVRGRIMTADGGRCSAAPGSVRLMAVLNGDVSRILTERAPRWGSGEGNTGRYGSFGLELANFGTLRAGDRLTLSAMCGDSGLVGSASFVVPQAYDPDSARVNLVLGVPAGPRPPGGVKMNIWGSGAEVRLYWNKAPGAAAYNVYRRDYRSGGVYTLIGRGVPQQFFTDKDVPTDRVYGYVVTALGARGEMSMHSAEVNNIAGSDFLTEVRYPGQAVSRVKDLARIVAFSRAYDLRPGYMHRLIVVRGVGRSGESAERMIDTARGLTTVDLPRQKEADERLYAAIPALAGADSDRQLLYWSAYSLMRQAFLPPEGRCHHNYYVFSREPQWGWGHGGQVFHESLTMLAYAQMDPASAMNSQRVFMERQRADGYINYRTGPYLDEQIPYRGQLTTSAPWYAWENWELYGMTHDRKFLEEAYNSSAAFYRYYVGNRDSNGDGLCEWGGDAVLESVRDGMVAVWDQVGWPGSFEAVDLNCMLVMETRSLAAMARELGKGGEAEAWEKDAKTRAGKINASMWDEGDGFYYHIGKESRTFTYRNQDDLKREEIIGFLPLWAGIASREQAARLVGKLTDPKKFWRRFGIPSLAADDRYYNPEGYWNGPVWVQWNYLIVRGLLQYGYVKEAKELTDRIVAVMVSRLKKDHTFWEFYSPDGEWGGYHATYLWAGIVARMMTDVARAGN